MGIEIYDVGFLYSLGDSYIVWGGSNIVWGFLYNMEDSYIVWRILI